MGLLPVCVRAHASDAQRNSPDWMIYPSRTASAWPLGIVIGVFANQKWHYDYMGGLGNKNPKRNIGVSLHDMSPLKKEYSSESSWIYPCYFPPTHESEIITAGSGGLIVQEDHCTVSLSLWDRVNKSTRYC